MLKRSYASDLHVYIMIQKTNEGSSADKVVQVLKHASLGKERYHIIKKREIKNNETVF